MESDDVLRLQMSIIVTMENSSKEFEENTQDLLDHLSIIYVATDKSETSGKVECFKMFIMIYLINLHHHSYSIDLWLYHCNAKTKSLYFHYEEIETVTGSQSVVAS